MKFKIPFTFAKIEILKEGSTYFLKYVKPKKDSPLVRYLINSDIPLTREEYIAICIKRIILNFVIGSIILTLALFFLKVNLFYLYGPLVSILFSFFVFITQINYPKLHDSRRQRNIEKNLIPALQDMLVQLNAGIPLYNIMVNISSADYQELSIEFKKAVNKINAGIPQLEVLEDLGEKNSSVFFRRTLWQVSNGMRAGSDISIVIKESIKTLSEEQLIQIQSYGSKLNPLIMFYMLISVIIPALAITFLTVIASLVNLSQAAASLVFIGLFVIVVIAQFMFLGVIKSVRPTLF